MKPNKKAIDMSVQELARYIDYSILKPEFTHDEIIALTKDAVKLGCESVCINPAYLDLCASYVDGSTTSLCPVCDFPFGGEFNSVKSKTNRNCSLSCIGEGNRYCCLFRFDSQRSL